MLVTGNVEIAADGKLEKMKIDQREALPTGVVGLIEESSKQWAFAPTIRDGKPMRAKGPMTLRVVAKKLDEDRYSLQISSATFGSDEAHPGEVVKMSSMAPPQYPESAARGGVQGTVYLILRIGREGKAQDAFAEQTNLRIAGTGVQMKEFRKVLERPALVAAKKWTFAAPQAGESAMADHWIARVPVDYSLSEAGAAEQKSRMVTGRPTSRVHEPTFPGRKPSPGARTPVATR